MSRAYFIYAIVAAVLIAGLWAILTFGSALEAPAMEKLTVNPDVDVAVGV